MKSSTDRSPSLAANLISVLFLSLDWLLRSWPQRVTCETPGRPLVGPTLAPDTAKYRGAAVISLDKRVNIPCSPLMSPAKRTGSTLGPLGFIYPFFLALQRVDWGVKFVRCLSCDRLTTSHTAFQSTKDLHVAFSWFTLSDFIFSTRHWSVLCLRKISGRSKPASVTT